MEVYSYSDLTFQKNMANERIGGKQKELAAKFHCQKAKRYITHTHSTTPINIPINTPAGALKYASTQVFDTRLNSE